MNPTTTSRGGAAPSEPRIRSRHAPDPSDRLRDADRSRQRILDAALAEFAAKGYAGARVRAIAKRAGVNAQLISYYFGGKEGLYKEIMRRWHEAEAAAIGQQDRSLADLFTGYLHILFTQPELTRILIWDGLTQASPATGKPLDPGAEAPEVTDARRRQAAGEIAADLDPAYLLIAIMGAVTTPVTMPQQIELLCGLRADSKEFTDAFAEQLRRILGHLRGSPPRVASRE